MGYSADVLDGMTQRHSRMMELLTSINSCDKTAVMGFSEAKSEPAFQPLYKGAIAL
jgi:hypothetical protein